MTTYTKPPATFAELIAPFPAPIQEAAAALRDVIVGILPEAHEHVSGGLKFANALYSLVRPTNVACGIQPTATHCKLYLHHVRPGDIPSLKVEGSGTHARHVKVASADVARRPEIAAAIAQARRGAGAGGPR
jgi:hypothetical protein